MSISQTHLSLDAPLTPGEDNKLLDYLPDNAQPDARRADLREGAHRVDRGGAVAASRSARRRSCGSTSGSTASEPMTLEEIGALLGITRERVRQIKEKALSRLRHVSRARALESYLGVELLTARSARTALGCRTALAPPTRSQAPITALVPTCAPTVSPGLRRQSPDGATAATAPTGVTVYWVSRPKHRRGATSHARRSYANGPRCLPTSRRRSEVSAVSEVAATARRDDH